MSSQKRNCSDRNGVFARVNEPDSGAWYAATDLENMFFFIFITKTDQAQLMFI